MQEALSLIVSLGEPYSQHPAPQQLLSVVNAAVSYAEAGRSAGLQEAGGWRADVEARDRYPSMFAGD